LIFPGIVIYGSQKTKVLNNLRLVFWAGVIFLSLKTLFLLFIFTHHSVLNASIYWWLRRTIVGEITPTTTGWPRIFIQSQIFLAISLFFLFWRQIINLKFKKFFQSKNLLIILLAATFISSLFLSFSRSFWVGLAGTIVFGFILIWRNFGFKRVLLGVTWLLVSTIMSIGLIYSVAAWPYVHLKSSNSFSQNFLTRVDSSSDVAIVSRWNLLPVLSQAIISNPILGRGFGSTLTYFSHDPRVLENNPTGKYTTYAFEWGYLGICLKLGLIGLAVYLLFLLKLVVDGLKLAFKNNSYLFFALSSGVIFLVLTNIFTPYLNHPLGIGFLVFSSCLIWTNRVY
jgi:O-antigen ligase